MIIKSKGREEWIDLAKVVTMLLVIVSHSSYYNIHSYFGGIQFDNFSGNYSWMAQFINLSVNFIYMFHMPFFMAISGMTYAISYKPYNTISSLTKTKARRLLLPMLMVTLFLSIPLKYISGYWDYSSNKILDIFLGQVLLFGNTHLWFLASLFIITIIFTLLYRNNKIKFNNIGYWCVLIMISYLGIYLSHRGQYLGIPGALKNFIYFAIGFCYLDRIQKYQSKISHILIGWFSMLILYIICIKYSYLIPKLQDIVFVPMALLGCYNMIATVKYVIRKTRLTKTFFYKTLNKNSYDIYLYSDPFNYVLITVLLLILGDKVFTGTFGSLIAFLIRIIFSLVLSYMVIFIMTCIRKLNSFNTKPTHKI